MHEAVAHTTPTEPVSSEIDRQDGTETAQVPAPEPPPWAGSDDPQARKHYLEGLEKRIAAMTAHIDSATGRLLKAIAEYDRHEGWARDFGSCAHWLSYRCQLNMRTARDRVRVARALDSLPRIAEALNQGKLSYAKVRAMARITKPENEKAMLYLGLNSTAEQMERIVQAYRRANEGESLEEVVSRQEARYLEIYRDWDGMVVIRAKLTPEVGAVVWKALEGALEMVKAERRKGEAQEGEQGAAGHGSAEPSLAHPPVVGSSVLAENSAGDMAGGGSAEPSGPHPAPVASSVETAPTAAVLTGGGSAEPLDLLALRARHDPRDPVPRIDIGGIKGLPAWGVIDDEGGEEWVLVQTPRIDDDRDCWYPPSKRTPPEGIEGEGAGDTDETVQDHAQDGSAEPFWMHPPVVASSVEEEKKAGDSAGGGSAEPFWMHPPVVASSVLAENSAGDLAGDGSAEPSCAHLPVVASSVLAENSAGDLAGGGSAEPSCAHLPVVASSVLAESSAGDLAGDGSAEPSLADPPPAASSVEMESRGGIPTGGGSAEPPCVQPPEAASSVETEPTAAVPTGSGSAEPPEHRGGTAQAGAETPGAEGRIRDNSSPAAPPATAAATPPAVASPPRPDYLSPEAIAETRNQTQDRRRDTLGQLRADALGLLAEAALGKGLGCRERGEPYQVVLHVDAGLLAGTAEEGRCDLEGGPGVSLETCRRIACDAPVRTVTHGKDGDVVDAGRKSRKIPVGLWRVLQVRDESCRFPGCYRTGRLQGHHIVHWAQGGETSRANVISLCKSHHWKVHEGGYRVEGDASGEVVFRRPDGSVIPRIPSSPPVPADPMGALMEQNRACGIEITPETNRVGWGGEPLDLVWIVDGILQDERESRNASLLPPFEKGGPGGISRGARPAQRPNSAPYPRFNTSGSSTIKPANVSHPDSRNR